MVHPRSKRRATGSVAFLSAGLPGVSAVALDLPPRLPEKFSLLRSTCSALCTPAQAAAAFRPGIAASQARHVAITLLATGPLIGLLWAAAARASHLGARAAPPWQWAHMPPATPIAFPLLAAVFFVTIWTALITLAATGRLTRWLPHRPRLAPTTAAVAGFGAATVDVGLLALLVSQLAHAPGTLAAGPIAVAAVASSTRLILARRAGQRCLASRASLA